MLEEMLDKGSTCVLCSTQAHQFVFDTYRQGVWCPRCGMPPVPAPDFLTKNNNNGGK